MHKYKIIINALNKLLYAKFSLSLENLKYYEKFSNSNFF